MREVLNSNSLLLFSFLILLNFLIRFVSNEVIAIDEMYDAYIESKQQEEYGDYEDLSGEYYDDLEEYEDEDAIWDNLIDLFALTVIGLIKVITYSSILVIGFGLFDGPNIKFREYMNVVIFAKIVYLSKYVFIALYFSFWAVGFDYDQYRDFEPLSLVSLFSLYDLPYYLSVPLSYLNVFELLFFFFLLKGVSLFTNEKIGVISRYVTYPYLVFTLILIVSEVYLKSIL